MEVCGVEELGTNLRSWAFPGREPGYTRVDDLELLTVIGAWGGKLIPGNGRPGALERSHLLGHTACTHMHTQRCAYLCS